MHAYDTARPSHTPSRDHSVELADGRQLAYAEWGPADGEPVVYFSGTPGSRLMCPDERATENAGVRLITFDRAGYGRSDVAPGQIGWAAFVPDVVELLDHLRLDRVPLVGWSGGGPHAMALAVLEPDRVLSVGLASSGIVRQRVPSEVQVLIDEIAEDPVGRRDLARRRCQWLIDDPGELARLTERYVPEATAAVGLSEMMEESMRDAGRAGLEGYINDYVTNWCIEFDLDLTRLRAPVSFWYGDHDRNVPPEITKASAELIPGSTVIACADCNHYTPVAHWPEILDVVLHR
jgi:pimeloyl-ACP methyl ester carboxylesterase